MATAKKLHEAIFSNSSGLVQSYLERGADPNACVKMTSRDSREFRDGTPSHVFVVVKEGSYGYSKECFGFTSIHAAVVNCYHNPGQESLTILNQLLKHGAKPNSAACQCLLCNIEGYKWVQLPYDLTPIDLAVLLKSYKKRDGGRCLAETLGSAMTAIDTAVCDAGNCQPQMVPVPKSVANILQGLLFSEEFSDVHFECKDGTRLPAHKNVLASSSSYFRNYFSGPWGEHGDGVWQTSNSPDIMRAVLTFIYTGEVPDSLLMESDAVAILSLAYEYELPGLVMVSEAGCIRKLDGDNVKTILQLAHLHDSKALKEVCFKYIRNNAHVLMGPEMMALRGEDQNLWGDLWDGLAPPSKRAKKSN